MDRKKIKETVTEVLTQYPKTRANDNELVYMVLKRLGYPTDYEALREYSANKVMSIVRYRQKAQAQNPLLRPDEQVSKRRMALEEKFRKEMLGV